MSGKRTRLLFPFYDSILGLPAFLLPLTSHHSPLKLKQAELARVESYWFVRQLHRRSGNNCVFWLACVQKRWKKVTKKGTSKGRPGSGVLCKQSDRKADFWACFFRFRQPRPSNRNRQHNVLWQVNRQSDETSPMESLNKSIEIVQRNQWNRSTKSMDLFH